jgi:hypothetical protein
MKYIALNLYAMGTHDCSALVEVLLEVEVILAAPSMFPSSSQKIGVAELEVQPTGILHSLTVRFSVKCLEHYNRCILF